MTIQDIQENVAVQLKALCSDVKVQTSQAGSQYLTLQLKDKTGVIEARLWNAQPTDIEDWQAGCVYAIEGVGSLYRQKLQFKITNYEKLIISSEELNDFCPQAQIDVEATYNDIIRIINNFNNSDYKKIMLAVLDIYGEKFKIWPAAVRIHHAITSGLLWHSYTMLRAAEALIAVYDYCELDADLLKAGIILHDMGKIIEIKSPINAKFSQEGKLIGHISIMQAELHRICDALDVEPKSQTLLEHMIISSHGKNEFGSPVTPRIIEAEILSTLDILDAHLYVINSELSKIKVNDQTPNLFPLNNRSFIRHYSK